eukprot:m.113851 g.113851  ORF g.113851 m.113851 type:complete len:782 (-) comp28302_c0_seq1:91-2436(-)
MEFELWQMARDWLVNLAVIPENSPALVASARVYDLALALQDGVVLCNTLNKMIPGSVETVHPNPEKQFLKMQNINSFLQACPNFGVKSNDLFTADELYYASNFQKVIACLSMLSRSNQAKLSGTPGFPTGSAKNTANDGDEDMYQSLEDLVGQSISFQESNSANASASFDPDEEEEDVYGSIRNVIQEDEDVYSDVLYRGGKQQDDIYATVTNPEDKRNHVLSEIFETEKNYVDVLHVITGKFMASLEASKLSKVDLKIIFSNVDELLVVHEELLAAMKKQMASKTGRSMSAPFQDLTPKMKVYGQFCCEIPEAIKKLKELMLIAKFAKILDTAKQASGQRFHLKDLLNVPMQRVLKYPLLIKELINSTPDSHPDKSRLTETQSAVKELAVFINTTKKDHDSMIHVASVIKKYPSKLPPMETLSPMQKDGDLKYKDDPKNKLKDTYLFLFQKALIWCKNQKNFQFADYLEVNEKMEVNDVPFWDLHKEEQQGKYTFAWSLKTASKEYWFAAKSQPLKRQWMGAMANAVDAKKEAMGIKPEANARGGPVPVAAAAKKEPKKSKAAASKKPAVQVTKGYEDWKPLNANAPKEEKIEKTTFARGGDEGWFGGKILRQKAEKLLESCPDGTYLVRESHTRPGDYSLSVQFNTEVKHIKINREGKMYDLASDAKSFPSIQELVEHFQTHSLNRHFPGMETTLAIPFKDTIGRTNRGSLFGQEKAVGIGRARSRFAYQAKSRDELTFERGIEIIVMSTDDQDPGWWKGQLPEGTIGMFPANYVQQMF